MAVQLNESFVSGDNLTISTSFFQHEGIYISARGVPETQATIDSIDQGLKKIVVNGDIEDELIGAGQEIEVKDSTGNDGIYTIVSISVAAGKTTIEVSEAIPDATADGVVEYTKVQYFAEFNTFAFDDAAYGAKVLFKNDKSINLPKEPTSPKQIKNNYKFNITKTQAQTDSPQTIADTLLKSELEAQGFTPANVVIVT